MVARQHQPDRLLPCKLRPPELEAADPAATRQPSSTFVFLSVSLTVRKDGQHASEAKTGEFS